MSGNMQSKSAAFDMWGWEYDRIDAILKNCTNGFITIRKNPEALVPLYDCLNELYRVIRPLLNYVEIERNDPIFKGELKALVFKERDRLDSWKAEGKGLYIRQEVVDELDKAYDLLMSLRQQKGLGIRAYNNTTKEQALGRLIGGKK